MSSDMTNIVDEDVAEAPVSDEAETAGQLPPSEVNLVLSLQKRIKEDKEHHKPAFDQMRKDMFVARYGRTPDYPVDSYTANITGRHIKQKVASLYAKNPKAVARRRETLDFAVWDEKPQSLQMAFQTVMMAQQALAMNPGTTDVPPEMAQAFATAQATIADFQQGMQKRQQIGKLGKTMEVLFAQALREQRPVDFKTSMKQVVRRASTTGVGYAELAFQREYGPRPGLEGELSDYRQRLDHLRVLSEKMQDGEDPIQPDDAEIAELQHAIAALEQEGEILVREGLVIDFPQSTRVIPDKLTKQLVGFVGARHLTVEYMYTVDQVKEIFEVDLGKRYTGYTVSGPKEKDEGSPNIVSDQDLETYKSTEAKGNGLVCVWKHFDKEAGLVYYLADGHTGWLREPAAPDVYVEDFWPVYALTFNAVESEKELFPPSDVYLMLHQQMEYNRSRQGMREHRKAARPRWAYPNGALEADDVELLKSAEPFEAFGLNLPPNTNLSELMQPVPVPGVDPNLYETGQLFTDVQLVVGSSEAQFGGVAKATATESAIAANASASTEGSGVDDLDAFLTSIARASGQILLREMSEETVLRVVGAGAFWPPQTLADIAEEIFLEVEAGSSGKPNQAVEIQNWTQMLPFLIQMPNIDPMWLARETIRRLDDRVDLTEAISEGMMSLVAQNQMAQASTGDPATDPNQQGGEGADNATRPAEEQAGSDPAFGSNQVPNPL